MDDADEKCIKFLGMILTPGTTRKNIVAQLFLYFGLYVFLNMNTSALGYLLTADFDVSVEDSG